MANVNVCELARLAADEVGGWRMLSPASIALIGAAIEFLSDAYRYNCDGDDEITVGAKDWIDAAVAALGAEMSLAMVGIIVPMARATYPDNILPCNGAAYQRADYPELVAVLPASLLPPAYPDIFWTPPLQGRTIIGAGTLLGMTTRTLGQDGGEENHMMTWPELVPHNHQYVKPVTTVEVVGAGAPLPTGLTVSADFTGVTPFGVAQAAFNIMQPFWVGNFGIIAR